MILNWVLLYFVSRVSCQEDYKFLMTTDDLENYISPDDLKEFQSRSETTTDSLNNRFFGTEKHDSSTDEVDCFGLGSFMSIIKNFFNMRPDTSEKIHVQYYFVSRNQPTRVQVLAGDQFGLEWVDFNPKKKTIVIIHGFMSFSNAEWIVDMTRALLDWQDVNIITLDWSGGGNTWKYWRAVANTRRVGSDASIFFRQLMNVTGANIKDFHLIGHSLGAHISSFISQQLGGVARLTGLDPAQPCFVTTDISERLDNTDADFVDIIHTNGRLLQKTGFGLPDPIGHADFYPNGGMKQPGCSNNSSVTALLSKVLPIPLNKLEQAICSHGRSYLLFTESLRNTNCAFRGHQWNLTYEGVNASIEATCDLSSSCAEMGINAVGGQKRPKANGAYFVVTTEREPYCPSEWELNQPLADLLKDLRMGFQIDSSQGRSVDNKLHEDSLSARPNPTTTPRSTWKRIINWFG